jgi:hypothetical protein
VCALANWSCRFVEPDCLRRSERRKRHDALVREDSGVGIATEIGGLHLVGAAPQIATDGRASGLLVQTSPTHLYNPLVGGLFTEFSQLPQACSTRGQCVPPSRLTQWAQERRKCKAPFKGAKRERSEISMRTLQIANAPQKTC